MTAGDAAYLTAPDRIARARAAQAGWAQLSVAERARALRPLRHAIAARMDEIIAMVSSEVGKPPMDALAGDVLVTLEQLRFYQRRAAHLLRPRKIGQPMFFYSGTRFIEFPEPHGVGLICAPWNYPLQLSVVPMATALFAGNAVLLKCSERTPRTARLIDELCAAAHLPPDLVQVSCENPDQAAALLEARPDFVFFTGSSRNGRAVATRAASLMIPAAMELGGKDPALVFDSCDLPRTVNGLAYGSFSNAGQVCVGTKRIYIQQPIYEEFLRLFLERIPRLRIGTATESDLGQVRFESVRERLRNQVADAVARGATLHTPLPGDPDSTTPLVLSNVPPDASLLCDESFGPVVCLAGFPAEADAVAMANASDFALSASVWTSDKQQAERVAAQLNCGSCAVNDVIRNIGNPQAGFGGNRSSGHGRYHGAAGLRTFSRVKSVMTATRPRPTEIHWFPVRARTYALLRGLLELRHVAGLRGKIKALTGCWMLLILLTGSVCVAQPPASDGSLSISVALPRNAHGEIAYLVFAAPDGFPTDRDKALRHNFVPVAQPDAGLQRIDVGPLPPGRYAISVYLDENGNRKLDKNWMGLPKEPVGVSNNPNPNAKNHFGPPRFQESAFMHGRTSDLISITLVSCCKP
jgi:acyl-CoA reductase-like NAD-dependent aldehyde dehydrogenase/uncharacterized protein (DUF2141 family)